MTRNLKVLGMALAMAFAFAAFASAASAATHHFDGGAGETLSVVTNENQVFTTTTGGTQGFICKGVAFNSTLEVATSTSVTVEPLYTNCHTEENGVETTTQMTLTTNGCHYTFQGLTTSGNPTGGEHANVELSCPEGAAGMTTDVTAFKLRCTNVPPQTIAHAVRYEDLGNGQVKVIPTAHGIESKTEGVCEGKEGVGSDQIHNNGSYTGSVTVSTPNGVSLSTTP